MKEIYQEILKEIEDEITSALKDTQGILAHQRRLAFSLSLGAATLLEVYLNQMNALKPGAKISHLWLKKNKENAKKIISGCIICPIENLKELDKILDAAYEIEKERNEIAYGKKVSEEILKAKISLFLELKKMTGEKND